MTCYLVMRYAFSKLLLPGYQVCRLNYPKLLSDFDCFVQIFITLLSGIQTSLVMSLMVSFCTVLFPARCLG